MAGEVTTRSTSDVTAADAPARVRPVERRPVEKNEGLASVDLVEALREIEDEPATIGSNGLAGALLQWLAPRPLPPGTLAQSRIVPLLGAAADLLARGADFAPEIRDLGAAALEQELRLQRTLAERRAQLGSDP